MRKSRGISSAAWAVIRAEALDRDNWRCRKCLAPGGPFAVHHVVAVHLGGSNELKNLISLCIECHIAIHRTRRITTGWERIRKAIVRT